MAEESSEDRWQRTGAAKPVGGDLEMLKERLAQHRRRRTIDPVVSLSLSSAQQLLDLLTVADQKGAFGDCEDWRFGGFCTVCTMLETLQSAILDTRKSLENGAGDVSRNDG